jgi:hypothetical protein
MPSAEYFYPASLPTREERFTRRLRFIPISPCKRGRLALSVISNGGDLIYEHQQYDPQGAKGPARRSTKTRCIETEAQTGEMD